MARKKVREYDAKRILKAQFKRLFSVDLPLHVAQVTASTDKPSLVASHPWLQTLPMVAKPDMLFGQRGKHGLVGVNLDLDQALNFIQERMGRSVTVNGCTGDLNTFVLEPFAPHSEELYLCIQTSRLGWNVSFSPRGGVDVESNWGFLRTVSLEGDLETLDLDLALDPLLTGSNETGKDGVEIQDKEGVKTFLKRCLKVFDAVDMTLLEMNPFTQRLSANGERLYFPLDVRMELDDTASYRSAHLWEGLRDFPLPFGRPLTAQESQVQRLDAASTASLKLSLLNPDGRVWLLAAGGGASVIYTDTVADLGAAKELGNYGEYSGAPTEEETFLYAREVVSCLLESIKRNRNPGSRVLIVGGGIANMTDVGATFGGIIQALRERAEELRTAGVKVFVRRGGPNYEVGMAKMRAVGEEIGISVRVYGPENTMTGICKEAVDVVAVSA
uniref:ATP citrate synthase n=1 Tax=Polytomella parva TaxID=51329 RepID=A0A6U0YAY1_9CHLO|mmetsp:Transcript_384/g.459  ORF Transcript_384/g.459 Transcript_384/m.459 type:complete len:444 (-) Transcript_384:67-1398(-)|eukprot:CAMPEP_0175080020 /NCGR_PEP_ID=MMETSP0052_2-20121109/25227_1 /TAXON_ID=51329 ORGANISM="Polytomella parva, Strain SAG 63-3" /NCGR_SAMPLE_ID=MMETSP0052_2 /ASSEMBLY_ACC=CAM_ASM_000194 /LENGTH=443 /DNA_ID=CAMNT_0016350577 /DNA_START=153 /DNA_END=1484 /DNA_ORIENTATION=+